MITKDKLQIVLVTYNRVKYLKRTLKQLLAEDSPVKDYAITVLDNASTDETSSLLKEYCLKYPNLTHIRRKINIGGDANICRAFEYGVNSGKEYMWVLCDDDVYDFTHWEDVEKEINNKTDVICVSNYVFNKPENYKKNEYLIFQLTFVPAGIYRTDLVTDDVLISMYNAIYTLFSQSCITINAINLKKKIKVLEHWIVDSGLRYEDACPNVSYNRGSKNKINIIKHRKNISWILGYSSVLTLLNDKHLEHSCMEVVIPSVEIHGCWLAFYKFLEKKYFNIDNFEFFVEIFSNLKFSRKLKFILYLILPISFYRCWNKSITCKLLYFIYLNIYSVKYLPEYKCKEVKVLGLKFKRKRNKSFLEQIFSIKNSQDRTHKVITILGIEVKIKREKNL